MGASGWVGECLLFFLMQVCWKTSSLFSWACHRVMICVTEHRTYCVCAETVHVDLANQSRISVEVTRTQWLVLGSCCNLFTNSAFIYQDGCVEFCAVVWHCCSSLCYSMWFCFFNRICFCWVELWYICIWCQHKGWWTIIPFSMPAYELCLLMQWTLFISKHGIKE